MVCTLEYNNQDELFINLMKKESYISSSTHEDKELFEKWINNEFSASHTKEQQNSFIGKLKNPPEQKSLKIQTETIKKEEELTYSPSALFEDWLKKNKVEIKEEPKVFTKTSYPKTPPKNDLPIIDLHGYIVEDALSVLKNFVFNLPQNIKKIRIIHGKGMTTGKKSKIREEVIAWLLYQKNHSNLVKDFSYEKPENGGHGATVVWFK